MDKPYRIDSVSEHDAFYHCINLHPLVSIIHFDGTYPAVYAAKMNFGFYAVYLKDVACGDLKYGKQTYDYQDKTLVFCRPGPNHTGKYQRRLPAQRICIVISPRFAAGHHLR